LKEFGRYESRHDPPQRHPLPRFEAPFSKVQKEPLAAVAAPGMRTRLLLRAVLSAGLNSSY
jgi:hypothetical protein